MKKHIALALALIITVTSLVAGSFSFKSTISDSTGLTLFGTYRMKGGVVSTYNSATGIAKIEVGDVQDGNNFIALDPTNGRRLFMRIGKPIGGPVEVLGFAVQSPSGKWLHLTTLGTELGNSEFGCPGDWDQQLLCYSHPLYNKKFCYTRCTPTEITLQLPVSGL